MVKPKQRFKLERLIRYNRNLEKKLRKQRKALRRTRRKFVRSMKEADTDRPVFTMEEVADISQLLIKLHYPVNYR